MGAVYNSSRLPADIVNVFLPLLQLTVKWLPTVAESQRCPVKSHHVTLFPKAVLLCFLHEMALAPSHDVTIESQAVPSAESLMQCLAGGQHA